MNGGVIGTMEGSSELSHTDSPESSLKNDINNEDDSLLHKLSYAHPNTDNHVEKESALTNEADIAKVVSNGIANHKPDNVTDETFPPQQENISYTTDTQNCATSNESCLGSATRLEIDGDGSYETSLKNKCNITSVKEERITDSVNGVPNKSESSQVSQECSETVSIKTSQVSQDIECSESVSIKTSQPPQDMGSETVSVKTSEASQDMECSEPLSIKTSQASQDMESSETVCVKTLQASQDMESSETVSVKTLKASQDMESSETVSVKTSQASQDMESSETVSVKTLQASQDMESSETVSVKTSQASQDMESSQTVSVKTSQSSQDMDCSEIVSVKTLQASQDMESSETVSVKTSQPSQDMECSETVSVKSNTDEDEDDSSQDSQSDVKIVESSKFSPNSKNSNSNACSSPEVQEIASDNENCVIEKVESKPVKETKSPLRRSSRAIKRKRYDDEDDESDVEEEVMRDLRRKSKAICTNNTKIEVALKQRFGNQKKENPIPIRDAFYEANKGLMMRKNVMALNNKLLSAQNLYQSILARGTTVTPVSIKNPLATPVSGKNLFVTPASGKNQPVTPAIGKNQPVTPASGKNQSITPASGKNQLVTPVSVKTPPQMQCSIQNAHNTQTAQPVILPSLTDDMFVVEAPSFIVPYVYEKPSIKPFREFVDELGKELAKQKAKEDELKKEKEVKEAQTENETPDTEIKETEEKSGDVDEVKAKAENAKTEDNVDVKKQKDVKKARRGRKRYDEDDVSWDGESSTDSDDDASVEEHAIVIKDKADPIPEIKDVADMTVDKIVTGKSENNYFDMTLGKFFMDIGLNSVQEYVQSDLLKQQNRKLYKEKKSGQSTKATATSIAALMKNLEISKENNAPYKFKQHKCKFCSFKSESMLVMSHHLETPHMKNNVYRCNFCEFDSKSPQDILFHMEAVHKTRGRLERAPAYHQCANCPFEDNGKGKLARHLIACAKKFKPEFNLSPPIEWEPPAKIPKMAKARNQMFGSYQNAFNKSQNICNNFGRPPLSNLASMTTLRPKGPLPMGFPPRNPVQGIPILRGNNTGRRNNPAPVQMAPNISGNNEKNSPVPKPMYQPSISITPLPRQPPPLQLPPPHLPGQQNKGSSVICEICDGYIKDLEQLRNHMHWIHKVKIHPKMIHNRPPLNCQKCQFRFFTDQGLERHLLGSHGLVTSSMQEAANKGKDAGRCPVCGRVYQWKLLSHVTRDHKLQLKPAHLSYKCTVCTATFGMYKQFENHVYSQHSVVAKRAIDKDKAPAPVKPGHSLLKPLKINDEITIIPQNDDKNAAGK